MLSEHELEMKLMADPNQENRRVLRTTMLTEVVAASDRDDDRAREWVMCVFDESITFEQLARIPPVL